MHMTEIKDGFRTDFRALFCRKSTERKNLMYGKQKEYRIPQVNESFLHVNMNFMLVFMLEVSKYDHFPFNPRSHITT